jgi:hypothetical protein
MNKHYIGSKKQGSFYTKIKKGRLTGLITSCAGNCLLKHVLKERWKGREDEKENVSC